METERKQHLEEPATEQNTELRATEEQSSEKANGAVPTPPSLVNDYFFVREIGHGGQAKVFLAIQLSDNKLVTVKQLNIESVKNWKEYDLFHREADVLSRIRIDGVAKFYKAIECLNDNPPCSYIVQEYIEGASLAKLIQSGQRFKSSEVFDILLQLLRILKQLHSMNPPVIHRDIKPSNIMITPDGDHYRVTLIDFGAVANPQVQSGGSTVAGTYGYMPPEQLMGRPSPASDIYSLAAVAVELFSGKSPAVMPTKDFRLIFEPDVQHLHPAVVGTLRSMLEPKVEDRLQNIDEITTLFKQYRDNQYTSLTKTITNTDRNKKMNQALESVESIGMPGNMDLWQMLPETQPRPVPEAIVNASRTYLPKPKRQGKQDDNTNFIVIILMLIPLFAMIFAKEFTGAFTYFLIAGTIGLIGHSCANQNATENGKSGAKDNTYFDAMSRIMELVENGRKNVATIESVTYIPITACERIKRKGDYTMMQVDAEPSFRVKYRFNPPDDVREEDLIHEFIAHTDPEHHYQPGDPLPILYQIEKNYFGDTVSSMPYPFPMTDMHQCDRIIFSSSGEYPHRKAYTNTDGIENKYDYKNNLKPMLDAKSDEALIRAMKEKGWLADDPEVINAMIQFGIQRILTHSNKNNELRQAFICMLLKIYRYAKPEKEAHAIVSSFILSVERGEIQSVTPCFSDFETVSEYHHYIDNDLMHKITSEFINYFLQTKNSDAFGDSTNGGILSLLCSYNPVFADNNRSFDILRAHMEYSLSQWTLRLVNCDRSAIAHYHDPELSNRFDYKYYMEMKNALHNPDALMTTLDKSVWLIDNCEVMHAVIQLGIEHIWSTHNIPLRVSFLNTLLKIVHYTKYDRTKQYTQEIIKCFFCSAIPGVKPCLEEYYALKNSRYSQGIPSDLKAVLDAKFDWMPDAV